MRGLAVVAGGVLLIGGAVLVAVADQERAAAVDEVRTQIQQLEQEIADSHDENLRLAEKLTELRSRIAEQDAAIADTTGFLQ
ncbi:hypothetical protein [Microbacterium sp. 179-I 3D3 NHS]|uniref:hypothetical protein n=1 Tax=unclassified Microbacterium TaxID=2609290 RepID=UPI0039A2E796